MRILNIFAVLTLLSIVPGALLASGKGGMQQQQQNAAVSADQSANGLAADKSVVAADEVVIDDDEGALDDNAGKQLNLSDGQSSSWRHRWFGGFYGSAYPYYGYGWGYPYYSYSRMYYPLGYRMLY